MRSIAPAPLAAILLMAAPAAVAAPTCVDRDDATRRCGVEGAMPVGWTPAPGQVSRREDATPAAPTLNEAVAIIYVVGAVFALIALMPPFDGAKDGDWDEQEGDCPEDHARDRRR